MTLGVLFSPGRISAEPKQQSHLPASDSDNSEGWVLNTEVSDEFNGKELDRDKWWVEGTDGKYHHWKGRAPSQFAGHNAYVKDGKLVIRTQWEPEFKFANETSGGKKYGDKLPVTTAAVIGKKRFLNGYMEVRTKAANASMTSAFWALGYQSELDVYEQIGNPKNKKGNIRETHFTPAIHDWRPGRYVAQFGQNKTFTMTHDTKMRVADGFHVYGCEWSDNYLKFYFNGKLVHEVSRHEIGDGWVLSNPLAIWFDSEIFYWLGNPHKEELPAKYEIDYLRIWQKPDANILDRAFFGFEGPITPDEFPTHESTDRVRKIKSDLRQHWNMGDSAKGHFSIAENRYFKGYRSLRFRADAGLKQPVALIAGPEGSVQIPSGRHELSVRIWIEPGSDLSSLRLGFEDDKSLLQPIDLTKLQRGRWVSIKQRFNRPTASSAKDRMWIAVLKEHLGNSPSEFYIDDVRIVPTQT